MGNSYRIKTTPGQDKNLVIQVDQDFEQLEILSLKIRQDDVYLRMCSDYGVIAGRVFANNGYGLPNAKVSVFVPILPEDENNPIISTIYPFKTLEDTNDDGYKFNLLPYLPSYSQHVPTGTFPSRKDALVNQTAVELYDKYYKYTVTTNDSGDYMIFGVPVGTQTLVMNLDLSDMGEFSLAPADLIRMGVATEEQFNGVQFKSSATFSELPQIVVINKTIEVSPFWGQEEICQIGITRSDFDVTSSANIDIKPTAIFMGSLMSSTEKSAVKTSNVSQKQTGELCKMITGPGEIIGITQTIFQDNYGLPVLKRADLPNGGKLIDGDGVWMFDVPMNNDYVFTNEFGEKVLSEDPSKGIPTTGKYRFKIKWQQSTSISEDYKRGYYIVPNIREKGWTNPNNDPLLSNPSSIEWQKAQKSYTFSLDWSAYTTSTTYNLTNPDIAAAVNCEDTFYQFDYNKVYTTASLIDNHKSSRNKEKFLGIKRIDDDTCEDSVNRYPVNDGVFHTTLIWRIFNILIIIIGLLLKYIVLPIYHIIAFLWNGWFKLALYAFLAALIGNQLVTTGTAAGFAYSGGDIGAGIGLTAIAAIWGIALIALTGVFIYFAQYKFPPIKLPMITYPDCDTCDCEGNTDDAPPIEPASGSTSVSTQAVNSILVPYNTNSPYVNLDINFSSYFPSPWSSSTDKASILRLLTGNPSTTSTNGVPITESSGGAVYNTSQIPFGERINLFNTKGKYYEGVNQVKITIEPVNNTSPTAYYLDNVIVVIGTLGTSSLNAGTMFSFVNPSNSQDNNITGGTTNVYGSNNITGTTTYPNPISITYANPNSKNSPNITVSFATTTTTGADKVYQYPSDIEYFQVLANMTVSQFRAAAAAATPTPIPGSFAELIESTTTITRTIGNTTITKTIKPIDLDDKEEQILIIQRGVDPYSPVYNMKVELGKIFGNNNFSAYDVTGDYRLNIPVRNTTATTISDMMYNHDANSTNALPDNGFHLYFPSYIFKPSPTQYAGYASKLQNYYSQIGYKLLTTLPSYYVDNAEPGSAFYTNYVDGSPIIGGNDVSSLNTNRFYSTLTTNKSATYGQFESFEGGSFMYGTPTSGYYFTKIYPTSSIISMTDSDRIVMKSDRLPSGDSLKTYLNNTLLLQQNNNITIYSFTETAVISSGPTLFTPSYGGGDGLSDENAYNSVLNSFDCNGIVQLECYEGVGLGLTVNIPCKNSDSVENGCYVFVKEPLLGLPSDFQLMNEYIYRFRFNYGLCQGVLSNVFNNNWINGNLYAYPFKVDTIFGSNNKVKLRKYPKNLVVLHEETNNFYYRSSPYDESTNSFIGSTGNQPSSGGNTRNLKTPTTILNMGPRESFLKEISLNNNFDGYNMVKMPQTTYKDLSEMINFFSIIRLTDSGGFLKKMFGNQITRLFSRSGRKVDADFAQSSAINSQIGVIPFDADFYTTSGTSIGTGIDFSVIAAQFQGTVPVAAGGGGNSNMVMMGIYFSSSTEDMQIRDYITPGRVIRYNTGLNKFVYDYTPIKSQVVPNYKWNINPGSSIFGSQTNEWATNGTSIEALSYQKMERFNDNFPVGATGSYDGPDAYNARGYLFSVSNLTATGGNAIYQLTPATNPNPALGGAPWYFYFGVKKGATAINKFYTTYIGETTLNG